VKNEVILKDVAHRSWNCDSMHITMTDGIGSLNILDLLRCLVLSENKRVAGLCGETVYIEVKDDCEMSDYSDNTIVPERLNCVRPKPGNANLKSEEIEDDQNIMDNFIQNLRSENAMSVASDARDEIHRMSEKMKELQNKINEQIKQGAQSMAPADSISECNGRTSKGKMKDYNLDFELQQNKDLDEKIEIMRKYIDKIENPMKPKKVYEDGQNSSFLSSNFDALTIFDTPHPSYNREDYESDLLTAHENSGILKIDGDWMIPRPPKTQAHTLIPKITADKWLNFLIRIHMALFLVLGKDPYPPADFMKRFKRLRRGKYSELHTSVDLLQVVFENTIDFEKMIVKRNNFCLPILEERMKVSESIIASCLISLLSEYKSRWTNLFKDCVIPDFVQPSNIWDVRSVVSDEIEEKSRRRDEKKRR
jgi:hypothetical protein